MSFLDGLHDAAYRKEYGMKEAFKAILPAQFILEEEPLSKHTSFRIGGPAEWMVFPQNRQELAEILRLSKERGVETRILGAGTNVLAPDEGLRGLVICLRDSLKGLTLLDGNRIEAMAGMTLAQTAMFAARNGLGGMEFAHGIPGTVGGGLYMNAGAYGGELKDITVRTEFLTADGEFVGFDIDLMNAIAEKMGYEVQYENMEFDGVVAAVSNGTTDLAISGLTINAGRSKYVNFSNPYYSGAAQVLIVGKNDTYYTGTDKATLDTQLKGQNIGVCSGYTGEFYAKGDEDWGFKAIEGANVKIYENISLAIADLKAGNINAIIMDDSVAKEAAAANDKVAKVIDVPLTVEEYGIAIDKTNKELKEKVDAALAELVKDGTVDKLLEKYDLK